MSTTRFRSQRLYGVLTGLLFAALAGCGPVIIRSDPGAFPLPPDAGKELRGPEAVGLNNAYKSEALVTIYGMNLQADLRQCSETAISLLSGEMTKRQINLSPDATKSITLGITSAQVRIEKFRVLLFSGQPSTMADSVTLEASYGDGTKSAIATKVTFDSDANLSQNMRRAVNRAINLAVSRLLLDENFLAYMSVAGERPKSEQRGDSQVIGSAVPAPQAVAQLETLPRERGPRERGQPYFYVGLGALRPERQSQLNNQHGQGAVTTSYGVRNFDSNVVAEIEALFYEQSFDTNTSIDTFGLGFTFKYFFPLGRFEPYVGAGAGLYNPTVGSSGQSGLSSGLYALLGADLRVAKRDWIGAQFRWLDLDADFKSQGLGTVRVGGYYLFATYRHTFGKFVEPSSH